MATLEQRGRKFRIVWWLGSQRFSHSLRTDKPLEARAALARLEDNLRRVKLGTLTVPDGADPTVFLCSDGRVENLPSFSPALTLEAAAEAFFAGLPDGSLEGSTVTLMRLHVRQLVRVLGTSFPLPKLKQEDLQKFVQARSKEKGQRGQLVQATTIKKALVTLRSVWNAAVAAGSAKGAFPQAGLRFPKSEEKPPFQTYAEIERQLTGSKLSKVAARRLWDALFLTLPQLEEVLDHVRETARHPFIYPMFAFAAYTGARRSELLRCELHDLDFAANSITIREKKRAKGKLTTRRVPLSPHEAQNHFRHAVKASRWKVMRGWHVFRHSFCSNLAAQGIDQRLIDAWVGHTTEEMRRRYRHLVPSVEQAVMRSIFGDPNGKPEQTCKSSA